MKHVYLSSKAKSLLLLNIKARVVSQFNFSEKKNYYYINCLHCAAGLSFHLLWSALVKTWPTFWRSIFFKLIWNYSTKQSCHQMMCSIYSEIQKYWRQTCVAHFSLVLQSYPNVRIIDVSRINLVAIGIALPDSM